MRLHLSLVVVGLFACGAPAGKPDYPTLDPAPPAAAPAGVAGDPVPEAPPPDPAEFAGPTSNPSGAPIAIAWAPAAVGERRTRDIAHLALYTSGWDDDIRRQRTVRHFHADERIAAVGGGRATALDAAFDDGRETVTFDDDAPKAQTLVSGEYRVEVRGDGPAVAVSRAGSGYPVGDREREELENIYGGGELGRDAPLLTVLKGRALRVGETVTLTAEEQAIAGGGDPLDVPIYLTLASVTDGVATFRFAFFTSTAPAGAEVRGVSLTFGVEVATGRLRTVAIVDARGDSSPRMRSASRMTETTTLTY